MHDAYKPQRKMKLTWEEIKAGSPYTIEQLADATYTHVLTQMMAHKAIKDENIGADAAAAMLAEYVQLRDKRVYSDDVDQDAITDEDDRMALNPIDLVKLKRDGRVKGRSCVDGRPQREHIPKEQCASPTIANNSLMLIMSVAAKERRKVATADVAGAYLHADMDDFVLVKFTGTALDLMCKVNPEYKKLIRIRNGKRVMYLRLAKALYGCLKSALLWYKLFKGTLEDMGFKLNKYDPCVANKKIKGKQFTIGWWVDDNAMTHDSDSVIDDVIDEIEAKFGKMTVTRGDRHTFLGMNFHFPGDGKVSINMKEYIEEAAEVFGEDLSKKVSTPANRDLFEEDEKTVPLDEDRAVRFRSVVMKLQWVAERGRPDVRLPIAYLTTRMSKSTTQDWRKLRRVLLFLLQTIDDDRVIGIEDIEVLHTWIDASYAVHPDMKSHTGGCISYGLGIIDSGSMKQKLNSKSSTESEVVGTSDYLSRTIWVKMFLEEQGYNLKKNILYQDNQSAIRLEKNGRMSCGQKSKHINIRFFWVTDRVKNEDLTIEYCPTESMLADFFTKPLQGAVFHKFREVIMGWKPISSLRKVGLI